MADIEKKSIGRLKEILKKKINNNKILYVSRLVLYNFYTIKKRKVIRQL